MSEPIFSNIKKNVKEQVNQDVIKEDTSDDDIKHDFPSMFLSLCKSVSLKTSIYLFILMVILFSQQFIEYVLFPIGGDVWVDGDQPTNIGTLVLCLMTSLGYIVIDLLINSSIL